MGVPVLVPINSERLNSVNGRRRVSGRPQGFDYRFAPGSTAEGGILIGDASYWSGRAGASGVGDLEHWNATDEQWRHIAWCKADEPLPSVIGAQSHALTKRTDNDSGDLYGEGAKCDWNTGFLCGDFGDVPVGGSAVNSDTDTYCVFETSSEYVGQSEGRTSGRTVFLSGVLRFEGTLTECQAYIAANW
jgi:hypothetical protein